jgi:hypothetical protein
VKENLVRPSRKEKRPKLEASMLMDMELDADFFLGPANQIENVKTDVTRVEKEKEAV